MATVVLAALTPKENASTWIWCVLGRCLSSVMWDPYSGDPSADDIHSWNHGTSAGGRGLRSSSLPHTEDYPWTMRFSSSSDSDVTSDLISSSMGFTHRSGRRLLSTQRLSVGLDSAACH